MLSSNRYKVKTYNEVDAISISIAISQIRIRSTPGEVYDGTISVKWMLLDRPSLSDEARSLTSLFSCE